MRERSASPRYEIGSARHDLLQLDLEIPSFENSGQKQSDLMLTGSIRRQGRITGVELDQRGRQLGRLHLRFVVAFLGAGFAAFFATTLSDL